MPRTRVQLLVTLLAVGAAVLCGVAGAALPPLMAVGLVAVVGYAWALLVVSSLPDPRRAALRVVSLLAAPLSWTAVHLGPATLPELLPLVMLPFAVVAAAAPAARPQGQRSALAAPLLIVVGGVLAAVLNDGSWVPVLSFALSAPLLMLEVYLVRPTRGEVNLLLRGLLLGIVVSAGVGLASVGASGRSVGLTIHSNQLAMSLLMMVPVTVHLIRERALPRWLGWLVVVVLVVVLLKTGSRSGLLALAVVLAAWSYHRRGFVATAFAGAAGAVAVVGIVLGLGLDQISVVQRLTDPSSTAASDAGRVQLLMDELNAILDGHQLWGTGFVADRMPHNVVLLMWGGFGLLGVLAWAWLMVRVLVPTVRRSSSGAAYLLGLACLGFVMVVSLNNLVEAGFFWLTVGLICFGGTAPQSHDEPSRTDVHVPAPLVG